MNVRDFFAEDTPALLTIIRSLPDYFTNEAVSDIENDLRDVRTRTLVSEEDGRAVGFLSYRLDGPEAELLWMAVHPSSHGVGVGSVLMKKAFEEMMNKNVKSAWLATLASTVPFPPFENTRKFHEKFGFREERIDKDYYGPGNDRAIMRKNIK